MGNEGRSGGPQGSKSTRSSEEPIEGAQQARPGQGRWPGATGKVHQTVEALIELAGDRPQPAPRVAQWQAGPLGQVTIGCRPVAGQVATGQLCQRTVSVHRSGGRAEPVAN